MSHSLIGKLLNDFVSKNLKFKFTDAWHIYVQHSVTLEQYILRADWNSPSIHIPLLPGEFKQASMFRGSKPATPFELFQDLIQRAELHDHERHLDHLLKGCIGARFIHIDSPESLVCPNVQRNDERENGEYS